MKQIKIIRKKDIRQLLLAVAMAAAVISQAHAAGVVTPKTESRVSADVVTLGDIFDGVTTSADHVLAPAPAHGSVLTLSAGDLQRVSEAFNLGWRPVSAMDRVVIRRDSNEVDRYQVEAALKDQLSSALAGMHYEVEISPHDLSLHVPADQPATVEVSDLRYDLSRGEFRAQLQAPAGVAEPSVRREVSGRLIAMTEVPVLKKSIRQGDVISLDDITYVDIRSADLAASTMTDAASLVGLTPRRSLPAMRPVSAGDVVQAPLVKKGELVTMTLQSGAIQLTAQGRALENGTSGSIVRVMNATSRQVLDAVVTGAQTVNVAAPTAALVAGRS